MEKVPVFPQPDAIGGGGFSGCRRPKAGRIFSFSLRKWSKKIGVGVLDVCPFLAGFGSFGDLSVLCIFVHIVFVTSRFPKPYVFFAAKARPCPPQAPLRPRANIFHFDSKWSKKIGPSLHRPAPHRLLVDAKWSKKSAFPLPRAYATSSPG